MSSTNLSPSTQTTKQVTAIAAVALGGIAYFAIVVVALHFLRPDYDPVRRFVSEYAVGPYGFLMTSAFFGLSLGSLALVIGLYQGVSRSGRSRMGLVLLGVWGVGVLIAGIFPTDLRVAPTTIPGLRAAPTTTPGTIHLFASVLAFFGLIPATILLSRRFKHDDKWRPFYRPALILSLVILTAFIGFFLTAATEFVGLSQRVFIVTFLSWLLLTAARLRSIAIQ